MIWLLSRLCACGKFPNFGYPDKRPTHCATCKVSGMINVVSKKCLCGRIPSYSLTGKVPTHCFTCKLPDMIRAMRKCKCGQREARWGVVGESPTACIQCKTSQMVNLKANLCASNKMDIPCPVLANSKYDNYCTHCFTNLFPLDPRCAQIKTKSKEIAVITFLKTYQWFNGFKHDKALYVDLEGGCCATKRRIDLRKLFGNTLICVEIDEHQHKHYIKTYEADRYNDLFMDFTGKYIFIRYNPDSYKLADGTKVELDFDTRMGILVQEIEKHIARAEAGTNELFEIHHVFYDEPKPPLQTKQNVLF